MTLHHLLPRTVPAHLHCRGGVRADTPQQQMGFGGYSVPCRVGNWGEDEYLGVLQTANHVSKETAGMLNSQQLSATLNNALAPVNLAESPADSALRFGDRIMCASNAG